jgi:hypothetical protein
MPRTSDSRAAAMEVVAQRGGPTPASRLSISQKFDSFGYAKSIVDCYLGVSSDAVAGLTLPYSPLSLQRVLSLCPASYRTGLPLASPGIFFPMLNVVGPYTGRPVTLLVSPHAQ